MVYRSLPAQGMVSCGGVGGRARPLARCRACGPTRLGRGQAVRLISSGRALDGHRVEPAAWRVVDLTVGQPVQPVTGRERRVVQGGQLRDREDRRAVVVRVRLGQPGEVDAQQGSHVVGRIAAQLPSKIWGERVVTLPHVAVVGGRDREIPAVRRGTGRKRRRDYHPAQALAPVLHITPRVRGGRQLQLKTHRGLNGAI